MVSFVTGTPSGGMSSCPAATAAILDSMHNDYIFQIVFDSYGRRMATCSADRLVQVWELQDSGEWSLVAQWQAHRGAVTGLAFCHPEFGHVLATCGSDHHVMVWEEKTNLTTSSTHTTTTPSCKVVPTTSLTATTTTTTATKSNGNTATNFPSRWMNRASLTDARRATTCLEFAPNHFGLRLAVGSADGCVRIYEAVDTIDLAQWSLEATLPLVSTSTTTATTPSTANNNNNNNNTSGHSAATAPHVSSLSWCTGRFEPLTLVVGGSQLRIFRYMEGTTHAWQSILQLDTTTVSTMTTSIPSIVKVAWAPNVGRRYHYIAATNTKEELMVFKLTRGDLLPNKKNNNTTTPKENTTSTPSAPLTLEWMQGLEDPSSKHHNKAWNCQWNVTGTVLASSGEDGVVQLWKLQDTTRDQFVPVAKVLEPSSTTVAMETS